MSESVALRALLHRDAPLVMPCAYDAFSARLIERAGFEVVGVTGAGIAASMLGMTDAGLTTLTEVVTQTRNIVSAVGLPVIADADTGYGNAINTMRTIREFQQAGVAGLFIEDQEVPKKCGHFSGKRLVSREEMVKKIQAALETRGESELVLIARTDARAVYGLPEAIERANAYRLAGADVIFVEAPESIEELRAIPEAVNSPLMTNVVEGGKTPQLSVRELYDMGYKIISFSNSVLRAGAVAMQGLLKELKDKGTTIGWLDRILPFEERNEILGLARIYELEAEYLPGDQV